MRDQETKAVCADDETLVDASRRELFKRTSAVGALGVLGAGVFATSVSAADFEKPKALLPGGQSDSRFPVSFTIPVSQGLKLVIDYFTALNQRDLRALAKTLHFPFAIYEYIEPLVYQNEAELLRNPPPSLNGTGTGKSRIAAGSYDILESVNVHLYCPVGGVFSLGFTRYQADGDKLLDCEGIYSVTNNDGRWAIQLVSTIIHEVGYERYPYPDAEMSDRLGSQGYLAAFGYRDEELLNDRSKGRGSFEPRLHDGTKTASVSFGYGPRDRTRNARANDPMRRTAMARIHATAAPLDVGALMGDFQKHAPPQAQGLLGILGAAKSMMGGAMPGFTMMGPGGPVSVGQATGAQPLAPPAGEAALAEAERAVGRPFPAELRQLYAIADGGFGPGAGLMPLAELTRRYDDLAREPYGPLGQDWPKNLLPLFDEDPVLACIDLNTGEMVAWDPEEIEDEDSDAD